MQVHISPSMRRITISTTNGFLDFMKVKGAARHLSYRTIFYTILILAFLLPFVFILTAVVTLEGVNRCSSLDCIGRRLGPKLLRRGDASPRIAKQISQLLLQTSNEALPEGLTVPESFDDLVADMNTNQYDAKTFALKIKAMVEQMEQKARTAKLQEYLYRHFASSGIPKGMHCLSLRLADEYSSNAHARIQLPSPELVPCLTDNSYHHIVLAATSSGSALLFPSLLAIFMWLAVLADARYPLETREQAFSNTLRPEQSHKDVAEKPDFGDPNSYEHTLRLPSEKDDSISIENSQRQPNDAYFQSEPVQGHRFESERGKSHMDVRGSTSGRFPLGGVRPFRYGRPGGSDHSERLPFLMRRGDYGRHQFPRRMGPDSIPSHVHFHGEIGAFNVFPTHSEPAEFGPEIAKFDHGFQPADLKQSDPYHAAVYEDGIPEKHINGVLPREPPALTSHIEKGEDPDVHWMGGLKSLFNRPGKCHPSVCHFYSRSGRYYSILL